MRGKKNIFVLVIKKKHCSSQNIIMKTVCLLGINSGISNWNVKINSLTYSQVKHIVSQRQLSDLTPIHL